MATKKLKNQQQIIFAVVAIAVLAFVIVFSTSGQTAKFYVAPKQPGAGAGIGACYSDADCSAGFHCEYTSKTKGRCEQNAMPDLVPGTKFEFFGPAPPSNRYIVAIEAKNIGSSLQLSKQNPIGFEALREGEIFFRTDSSACSVLDVNHQRKEDQTVWGTNEYLDCGGSGQLTNTKFTFKVDTTNKVSESNEANNELTIGG